jgi:DNA-binding response OmpR family regulator
MKETIVNQTDKPSSCNQGITSILIVDDEAAICRALSALFSHKYNIKVLAAFCGREAVEIFCRELPQVVFLDIGLPDINGLEVLRRIKAINPAAKVYVVSGFGNPVLKQKADELGAAGYFTKPVSFDELAKVLTEER